MKLQPGQKVKFADERWRYTVRAANDRFAICTRPFFHHGLYTIVDWQDQVRGTENLIFCAGFETDRHCTEALRRLASGATAISSRNCVPLNIEAIA